MRNVLAVSARRREWPRMLRELDMDTSAGIKLAPVVADRFSRTHA